MATGIPKSRTSRGREAFPVASAVRLAYEGKKPVSEILATPPAEVLPVSGPRAHRLGLEAVAPDRDTLFFGDNLGMLASLLRDPQVRGQVRLVYIDPPFATRSGFESRAQESAYDDLLGGAAYVEFLRERLVLLRELLADDGSLYLHLDERMAFVARTLLDEIFGPESFRNVITRKKCNPKNSTQKRYGNVTDFILFFTKSERYVWNRPSEAWNEVRALKEYTCVEPGTGRRYKRVPLHAPGVRHGETGRSWRGMAPPPGKHWQYPPTALDELDARGEIHWSKNGNPRRKIYLDQSPGVPVQDLWLDFKDAHNQTIRITGYPTEKNEALLERIVAASSNPGDLVLDCFAGSGTTLAVAHRLGRRWIGMDDSPQAIATILARLTHGTRPMGDYVKRRRPSQGRNKVLPLFPQMSREGDPKPPNLLVEAGTMPRLREVETAYRRRVTDLAEEPADAGTKPGA